MLPPRNIHQLRSLQGKIQSICSFITQLADKRQPFQHLLHRNVSFRWDDKCEQDFQQIKKYLMSPPVLVPPTDDKPLLLYISTTTTKLGALLAQHGSEGK